MYFSSLLVELLPCPVPVAGISMHTTLMALVAISLGCGFRAIPAEGRTSSVQLVGSVLRAARNSEALLFCMTWGRHVSVRHLQRGWSILKSVEKVR